ncbi:hypothetical protein PGT21_000483 [Puccinia graminis f. sp. tritici]|uniref:Uncharacterized protein n=1 Tax=Puccinia graminis f. sp. tritici TaxID=56615 RepID=A0A5B0MJ99_PUCGR|nr:hypothetical protein PGT21_000483 [Puccinia graminis f. sp. tritici]KAA1135675.1 hypothetical protein PGTUg99_030286 [Puccinia graminis f. sp. tritici]
MKTQRENLEGGANEVHHNKEMDDFDVDSWNVTVAPKDLLENYCLKDSLVQLLSHAPSITDHQRFEKWVFVGKCGFYIHIPAKDKENFFKNLIELGELSLCMAEYEKIVIDGAQSILASLLVRVMVASGITQVRLNAFGMKAKLEDVEHNYGSELANAGVYNWFDIGVFHKTKGIPLFKPIDKSADTKLYPMSLDLGKGYGTVSFKDIEEEEIEKIKVYSCLVHALKSTSAKHLSYGPTNTRTWHTQLDSIEKKATKLEANVYTRIEGFRIELTIHCKTLKRALRIARKSGYLNFAKEKDYVFNSKLPLDQLTIHKKDYFDNIFDLVNLAREKLNVQKQHDQNVPLTELQSKALIDVAKALGWNTGRRRGHYWDDPNAWWHGDG